MHIGSIFNLSAIAGSAIISRKQRAELIAELLNPFPQVMAFVAIFFAAIVHGLSDASWKPISAVAITGTTLAGRFVVSRWFGRTSHDPRWVGGFVVVTLLTALGWGAAGFLLFIDADAKAKIAVLAALCAIVQGVAARAYSMPGAAFGNIVVVLTCIAAAAVCEGWYFMAPGCALYLVFLSSFIGLMVKLRLKQLKAERATDALLREIQEKNALLYEANARLAESAMRDSLTKLGNRRLFDKTLVEEFLSVDEGRRCLSLLLIDVDYFKRFNDSFGHQAGDMLLQMLAGTLTHCVPESLGLVARYGGEEFAIILPDRTLAEAAEAAEAIRVAVSLLDLSDIAGSPPRQSVSIGVAEMALSHARSPEDLLRRADGALYEAKRSGRNAVRSAIGKIVVQEDADLAIPEPRHR